MNNRKLMHIMRLLGALTGGVTLAFILLILLGVAAAAAPQAPPVVVEVRPAPNVFTASRTSAVYVLYDQPISPTTVDYRSFAVHAMQTGWLSETLAVQGGKIVLTPTQAFFPGELVQASATTATLNMGGEAPLTPTVWQFRTAVESGSGYFVDSGQLLGNEDNRGLALGDLDGDSDLDAFVPDRSGPNRVWLNDGIGGFTDSGQVLGTVSNLEVALGDLDGDGDLDAFVARVDDSPNEIWLNDGTGGFTNSGQSLGNSSSFLLALGDLDGDGDLDAFIPNGGGGIAAQPDKVWLNDGAGIFADSGQTLGNGHSACAALGDVDADGDLDAVVAAGGFFAEPNTVWINDGDGNFLDSGQALGNGYSIGCALGDLDKDGDLDAYVSNYHEFFGEPDEVWLNDGAGIFTLHQSVGNSESGYVDLGDLEGDGDLDVLIGGPDSQVWTNDGTGTYSDSGQNLGPGAIPVLGDLDGDGDLDVFLADGRPAGPNTVWLNQDPLDSVSITGPAGGVIQTSYTFTASMAPVTSTVPVNYVWQASGQTPVTHTGGLSDTVNFTWGSGGVKAITVTASNLVNTVTGTHAITIEAWVEASPVPHITSFYGSAQCEDDPDGFYVIGGAEGYSDPINDFYHYDAASDTWAPLADLPIEMMGIAATCYEGKIYAAGGWRYPANVTNLFHIYDITSNTWTTGPPLPRLAWGAALGAWDGKLFLAGGAPTIQPITPVSQVDIYDIASGVWTAQGGAPMPAGAYGAGEAQVGPYLFMVGGWADDILNNLDTTQRYDMSENTWLVQHDFPSQRAVFALATTGSRLYAIGGDKNGGTEFETNLVEYLDIAGWPGMGWQALGDPLPDELFLNSAGYCTEAVTGGEVWSVGGAQYVNPTTASAFDINQYRPAEPCLGYDYALALVPDTQSGEGYRGGTVDYTLTVTNTGDTPDAYTIDLTSTWTTTVSGLGGALDPDQGRAFTVTVEVPAGAALGESDLTTLTLTSQGDPAQVASAGLTTTAVPRYGLALTPDAAELFAHQGAMVTYTLQLTNMGDVTDTFTLAAGEAGWTVTLPVTETTLTPGEGIAVNVLVAIPADAPDGGMDTVIITATSQGDPLAFASSTLTTVVWRRTYLPLITSN
jgi:hypothetical protein